MSRETTTRLVMKAWNETVGAAIDAENVRDQATAPAVMELQANHLSSGGGGASNEPMPRQRAPLASLDEIARILKLDVEARTIGASAQKLRMTEEVPRRFSVFDAMSTFTGKVESTLRMAWKSFQDDNSEVRAVVTFF